MSGTLAGLERAVGALQAARDRVHEQVLVAVAGGASWAEVGRALGMGAAAARRQHQPVLGPRRQPAGRVRLVRGWACSSPAVAVASARRRPVVTATWSSAPAASAARVPVTRSTPVPAARPGTPPSSGVPQPVRRRPVEVAVAVLALVRRVLVRLRR